MADDSARTVCGRFETREAADRAIEQLVQQFGVARTDVFVRSADAANSAGTAASGGDVLRADAPLNGRLEVSADVRIKDVATAERALRNAGAAEVTTR